MTTCRNFAALLFPVICYLEFSAGWQIPPGYTRVDDMIVPFDFLNSTRNAVPNRNQRWYNGRVPYVIHGSLNNAQNNIYRAMQEYHSKTCIRFVQRTNEPHYVKLFYGNGCFSMIGVVGGEQSLSLGQGCWDHGTIVHELGHAIGFYHEQNRSDRDDHINIIWNNIDQSRQSQFYKMSPNANWLINSFDTNSIMLYGELAFSRDGRSKTMVHKNGQRLYEVYQKNGLSYSDVRRINRLYAC